MNIDIFPVYQEFERLLELYPPQLANKFLPDWYKKQDFAKYFDTRNSNQPIQARNCPAIQEVMTDGIIIPAWSDIYFWVDEEVLYWEVPVSKAFSDFLWIGQQGTDQVEGMPFKYHKNFGILKLNSPYYFRSPEGYGIEFSDPAYHLRRDIKVLSGRVESDIWHETNFPFEFQVDVNSLEDKKLMIKAGEPLIMMRLYKKEINTKVHLSKFDKEFVELQATNSALHTSQSQEWVRYKKAKNETTTS